MDFFRDLYIGTGFLEPKSPPSRLPARMDLKKQLICPYNRTTDADPVTGANTKRFRPPPSGHSPDASHDDDDKNKNKDKR